MNSLENALLIGTRRAQQAYQKTSGGWWLSHGPESFIQAYLAQYIARTRGFDVYPECSPKRWKESVAGPVFPGRPPKINDHQRFDLVVWTKSGKKPRAVVELKRAYGKRGIVRDAKKVWAYRKEALRYRFHTAYLVVYSEARDSDKRHIDSKDTLDNRFQQWEKTVNEAIGPHCSLRSWRCVKPRSQGTNETWSWGVALYKIDVRK